MRMEEYRRMYELEENHWWYVGRRRIFAELLESFASSNDKLILDAGCGTGGTVKMLSRWGKVIGCDKSYEALSYCRQRGDVEIVAASILNLPFENRFFDMVASFDVLSCLEHREQAKAIAQFRRVLKPEGLLAINVPAYQWLRSRHDDVVGNRNRLNRGRLSDLLQRGGFSIQKISHWNMFLFPAAATVRLVKKFYSRHADASDLRPVSPIINRLMTAILAVEAIMLKSIDLPFGLSILVIARKESCELRVESRE